MEGMERITTPMLSPKLNIARRLAVLVTGYGFMQGSVIVFDHILYGSVLTYFNYLFGPIKGGTATWIVMAPLSALVCLLMIKGYDYLKVDWLGFETIKEFKEKSEGRGMLARLTRYLLHKGDVVAFIALSAIADPFVTTVYMRRGKYNGMSVRDHKIFWGSVVLSNAFWTIRWTIVVEFFFWVFSIFPTTWQNWILGFLDAAVGLF